MMKDLIPISAALKILTLFREQRLTTEERERINSAVDQLSRAQVDPEYRAWLHIPLRMRNILEKAE